MQKVIVIYNGASQVCPLLANQTAESIAEEYGVSDPALYQEFSESDFDAICYGWVNAFTLVDGVVGFDLDKAKQLAEVAVNVQSNGKAKEILAGLSYDVYVAQCSLPADQRIAKYQAAIDANNSLAVETENREQAIYAAETIQEVNDIVYPPKLDN